MKRCDQGHSFNKTSDCPVCPICEKQRTGNDHFFVNLSAPARRALENNAIKTLYDLTKYSENEILRFHGIGQSSIPILRKALSAENLKFRE